MYNDFGKLIKNEGYQIFLFICPASLPFYFAIHPWFVCVKDGQIDRWEVRFEINNYRPELGKHLHLNRLPAFSGIEMINFMPKKFLWKGRLFYSIEGEDGSLAHQMYEFISNSKNNYPYRDQYNLLGPNSNTYAEWVLSSFSELNIKLPWNSLGKRYIEH